MLLRGSAPAWDYGDAGTVAVVDTRRNRRTLRFHWSYRTAFVFPRLCVAPVSWVATRMDAPFHVYVLPAAFLEGWSASSARAANWTSRADARCYCSLACVGRDQLVRRNFGRLSYRLRRIVDGDGRRTIWWRHWQRTAALAGATMGGTGGGTSGDGTGLRLVTMSRIHGQASPSVHVLGASEA